VFIRLRRVRNPSPANTVVRRHRPHLLGKFNLLDKFRMLLLPAIRLPPVDTPDIRLSSPNPDNRSLLASRINLVKYHHLLLVRCPRDILLATRRGTLVTRLLPALRRASRRPVFRP
jgi:hypothetical protein